MRLMTWNSEIHDSMLFYILSVALVRIKKLTQQGMRFVSSRQQLVLRQEVEAIEAATE